MMRPRLFSQPWVRAVALWGAASLIASVQCGTISVTGTADTATIVAVDLQRAVLCGSVEDTGAGAQPQSCVIRLELTNATTVTAYRNSASTGNASWQVVEFMPGVVKSIQRGTISTAAAASGTATITEVNTAKSWAEYTGFTTTYAVAVGTVAYGMGRVVLTNSTTVTFNSYDAITRTVGFGVVEFF